MATSSPIELEPQIRIIGALFGGSASRRRGVSDDIVGSRAYQPGDDIRRINWAASARISALRGEDQFVVRESYGEEAPVVCLVLDRAPSMGLYPREFPWLHKPEAVMRVGHLIALAAAYYRCPLAYLDDILWQPPRTLGGYEEVETLLEIDRFDVEESSPDDLFLGLQRVEHLLPPGSFIFVLSDFLSPPSAQAITMALDAEWDLVPVVIRDPLWEQSYPEAAAEVALPVAASDGSLRYLRQSRAEVAARRAANEQSLASLDRLFSEHGFPPVIVGSTEAEAVAEAFVAWHGRRGLL